MLASVLGSDARDRATQGVEGFCQSKDLGAFEDPQASIRSIDVAYEMLGKGGGEGGA